MSIPTVKDPSAYTVLVDMDGVICEWQKKFNSLLAEHYPHIEIIPEEELTVFKAQSLYPEKHRADITEMMNRPGFYRTLEPMPGASKALNEMLDAGLNVFLCTAPFVTHESCASEKMLWAEEHLGLRWKDRMVITSDKTLVRGDVLIDDKPAIKGSMTPTWTHIVYDASYNRHIDLRLDRWDDWQEVIVGELAKKELVHA